MSDLVVRWVAVFGVFVVGFLTGVATLRWIIDLGIARSRNTSSKTREDDEEEVDDLMQSDDLLKSVRALKSCKGCELPGPNMSSAGAVYNPKCDACLRLVLAHCGEKAVDLCDPATCEMSVIRSFIAAIRREFGGKV